MDNNCFILNQLSKEQFFTTDALQITIKPEHCGNESAIYRAMICNQYRRFMQNNSATSIDRIVSSILPGNKAL